MNKQLGPIVQGFFAYHLVSVKGLSLASIRSYRDAIRLFFVFVASTGKTKVSKLALEDLSFECVLAFLDDLEKTRKNRAQTRNQRLAALHVFYDYVAAQVPEMLAVCQRVAAVPRKRARRQEVTFLERDEVTTLIQRLPARGARSLRDRALILLLYNTGARVDEVSQLRVEQLELKALRVRLLGKGGKWRTCPLWKETAQVLLQLIEHAPKNSQSVFLSTTGRPLTRFGIYKIVRRHGQFLDRPQESNRRGKITPHVFRHTTAVHLLESGVELNVIRGWLGHADISSTQHYAEINTRAKEAALRAVDPFATKDVRQSRWRSDEKLLTWLASL
jgi:site-specific recombinase XerD